MRSKGSFYPLKENMKFTKLDHEIFMIRSWYLHEESMISTWIEHEIYKIWGLDH